jgi:hypothetical protein
MAQSLYKLISKGQEQVRRNARRAEQTIIRTLLPNGAARHAGAQVGSLVAEVGNIDTSTSPTLT